MLGGDLKIFERLKAYNREDTLNRELLEKWLEDIQSESTTAGRLS